ncbi:ATP-dependent zinc protease family protein [Vibrio sp. WXL103]|uniref:ATP-dependent zinc protease family protein n=1 Tax=unclassified Vibrio TaxID=2614977 RepID=UPI003EC58418
MTSRLFPALVAVGLSGCATTDHVALHEQTLEQVKSSQLAIVNKINRLELQISNQSDYIESLEYEIAELNYTWDLRLEEAGLEQQVVLETEEQEVEVAETIDLTPREPYEVVLGGVERVTFDNLETELNARVDTGASISSLNAADIEQFERNGKRWVRFHIADSKGQKIEDASSEPVKVEAPVARMAKIRQSSNADSERRYVIDLWVRLGDIHEKTQFTLANRSHMTHPVLLGRDFIRDIALVDVSKDYIHTERKQQ